MLWKSENPINLYNATVKNIPYESITDYKILQLKWNSLYDKSENKHKSMSKYQNNFYPYKCTVVLKS